MRRRPGLVPVFVVVAEVTFKNFRRYYSTRFPGSFHSGGGDFLGGFKVQAAVPTMALAMEFQAVLCPGGQRSPAPPVGGESRLSGRESPGPRDRAEQLRSAAALCSP